jgi:ATP-dependent Lon protease
MKTDFDPGAVLDAVAVFPLPQVVLFPGALMPLHIFEPRYRAMTRDVLGSTRTICVAQIPEDHGMDAHGQPHVACVAGVGEIVKCDALADGRFNILVQGKARAKVDELPFKRPYRRAQLTILEESRTKPEEALVRALVSTAHTVAEAVRQCHPQFQFALPQTDDPALVVDACAHYLVMDGSERQKLLEILDVNERVHRCLETLVSQQALFGCIQTLH